MKIINLYIAFACVSSVSVILSLPIMRLFKISIEEIGIFLSPIFNLLKFNIKDCEVKIGWLPLSGYVKVKDMVLSEGDLILDHSFIMLKPWQKLFLYLLMPIIILFVLTILKISNGGGLWSVGPLSLILGLIGMIKYLDIENHNYANTVYTEQHLYTSKYIISLMIYLGFLIAFLILLYIAYFYDGSMTQYFDSDLLTDNVGDANTMYRYIVLIGLFCVTINMLPLSAMPGVKTVDLFYESLTSKNLPSNFQNKSALYGLPIILIGWIWFLKFLIVDLT